MSGDATISVSAKPTASETNPTAAGKSAFTFTRVGGDLSSSLDVAYSLSGTATDTADYGHLSGIVHFAAGARSAVVALLPVDDAVGEGAETVIATITPADGIIVSAAKGSATVTIADNESVVGVTAVDGKSKESGDPAKDKGSFKISRTGGLSNPVTVEFVLGGTADAGDYVLSLNGTPVTNTVTIPAGVAFVTLVVTPADDTTLESEDALTLTLVPDDVSNPTYSLAAGKTSAAMTIGDNDSVPTVTISAPDADADESGGTGTYTFTRTGSTANDLVVSFQRIGTAGAGDYKLYVPGTNTIFTGNSITIPAGSSSISLELRAINDSAADFGELATLKLVAKPTYNLLGAATQLATVTIADDEPIVTIEATDASAAEPGTDTGTFRITRTGSTLLPLDIKLTKSGKAIGNTDYVDLGSIVTIPAGETFIDLTVYPLLDIATNEGVESLTLSLSPGSTFGVDPATKSATVDIADATLLPTGPDVVPVKVTFARSNVSIGNPGEMNITVSVTNFGTSTAYGVEMYVYINQQHDVYGDNYVLLGHFYGGNGGYTLAPGATKTLTAATHFTNLDPGEEGEYYLEVDVYTSSTDLNEDNNFYLTSDQQFTVVP
jgi:hypothetical protein